jgi:transposase
MTTYSSREELENLVVTRHRAGWSGHQLAKDLHISRNTVRKILRKHQRARDEGHDAVAKKKPQAPRPSKLDEHVPQIEALLKEYPNITGQRVFEELRESGYEGGITIVRDKLLTLRPKPKRQPTVRFETAPGKQGQMDWSPYKLKLRSGRLLQVLCFSYVLGFSRRQYIDFVERRDFHTLIRRHRAAFEYFEGVPEECLYDSEKTVVLRWEANQPLYNPSFLQFIPHYDCRPVACQRGRPQTKGKVEAPFLYVESNLLGGRTFVDLEDLRRTARWWLANRSDPHIHDTTRRAPLELFLAEEASALQPLPVHPYVTSEVGFRVCSMDGFIEWATNRYSVDYEHVGEIMTVKATEHEIVVYSPQIRQVARHERRPDSAHEVRELPEHRVNARRVRHGLEPVRETFLALGEATEDFLAGLQKSCPRNAGYHARRILLLKDTYSGDDIHRALVHALRYHAHDCMAVERILKARARPRTLEQHLHQRNAARLRGALPRIEQRSLSEYGVLLGGPEPEPPSPPEEEPNGQEEQEAPGGGDHRAAETDPELPPGAEAPEDR